MATSFVFIIVLITSYHCVYGILGIDAAGSVISVNDYKCLKDNGYDYVITRAWESLGQMDPMAASNLKNAQASGYFVKNTSVYMFPCASTTNSAAAQMNTMIKNLEDDGVEYDMIWLDIEENPDGGCSWTKNNIDINCNIILALGYAATNNSKKVGVYSNYDEWGEHVFFGNYGACTAPAMQGWPLWYADYDGAQNFNDFAAFGGWTKPVAKQYAGDAIVCGLYVDLNWEPSVVNHNDKKKRKK